MTYDRLLSLVHPDDRTVVQGVLDKVLHDGRPFDYLLRGLHGDGTVRVVQSRVAEFDESGEAVRIFGTVQDVTERERSERSLRESEARSRGRSRTRPSASPTRTSTAGSSASTRSIAQSSATAATS